MTTVADLMTMHVDRIPASATLGDAARCMVESRISSVIVVENDTALGIVTERDMLHAMRQHRGRALPVTAVMTSPVHTVQGSLDFREAFRTAARLGIRHLVVGDPAGHPVGVVTETDFRRHLGLDFFRQLNTVDVLMERTFPRLPASASLDEALLAMEAVRGSCVVVVDGHTPLGIVTERDVVRLYLQQEGSPLLGEVMTHPVASVHVDTPLAEAAEHMMVARIRHLTVLDGSGRLVGLLTEHSLMRPLELDMIDDVLAERLQLSVAHDLDLRKMARNEHYQRALLDNFPFLVWLKDTESRFLAVNQPLAEALGESSVDTFVGRSDFDFSPPEMAEACRADDAEVMARGEKKVVVERYFARDKYNWVETYRAPVRAEDGSLLGTVGFARDISERKCEEEATLIRNAAMAGLLRGDPLSSVLGLIVLSLETELQNCLGAVFTCQAADNSLRLAASPSAPEDWQQAIRVMPVADGCGSSGTAAFRRQKVIIEDVLSDPLGADFRALALAAGIRSGCSLPLFDPEGMLLGVFTVYNRQPGRADAHQDSLITQCSQLLALILTQQANVLRVENTLETFRGIFNSATEPLLVQGADGVFLDANQAAEVLFGFPPGALIGLTHGRLAAEGLNDFALIAQHLHAAAAGAARGFELWAKDATGRIFPCAVKLHSCSYFGRQAVIASVQDISERKAAEQRLRIEHDLADALVSGLCRQEMLATFLDIALRFPEFECGGLYLRQADGSYQLAVHRGFSGDFVARASRFSVDSPQARLVQAGEVVCSCCRAGECCTEFGLIHATHLQAEGLRCLAILPLMVDGEPLACLKLAGSRASQITRATYAVLQSLRQHFVHTLMRLDAQEEAVNLQKNLSGLFDTLRDFLFVLDAAGRIQHYNRAVSEALGYGADELKGLPVTAVNPAESREMGEQVVAEGLAGKRNSCLLPLLRRDGSRLLVETRVVAGFWNGEPALFSMSQDISERLLAEDRQKLAVSVFENAHEGIMISDPQGQIVDVNPTFSELTGYRRDEAIGRKTDLLKSGHHEPAFYTAMWQTILSQGYWRGEVWNRKKSGEIFVELLTISAVRNHEGLISHFVSIFSDITLLKEHQERLEHLAHFDALTKLPNRMLLADRLHLAMAQTERSHKILAIAYLDLDDFKPVNDALGHAAGDRLLIEVAQRLRQCVRAGDTVARLGGDEFVLLFSALEDVQECERAVSRVLSSLAAPFCLDGRDVQISASIGVTLYPLDGADADTLLRHADQAMYSAKQGGRNRFHLFDPESDRRAQAWREELGHIRQAFADDQFVLYYQPKVNMREGRVLGAEALIRWRHPERGLLLPAAFLPAIEGSDLDVRIGEWVIRSALQQLNEWVASGFHTSVSVNISGPHLLSPGFTSRLADLLASFPAVRPEQLELEILETAALEDMVQAAEIFLACRQLGISFALDDFGTGYSSLTYFRRLPADVLKIDQSFVRDMLEDPDDLAIVEGIIGLTQAFHRKVIAEGVETPEHGMLLLQLGCDLAQGFGIARPMPPEELPAWTAAFLPDELWGPVASFKWSREDLPMLIAEGDHLRWLSALDEYLANPQGGGADLLMDHTRCRFGRWYYGPARTRYGALESYRALEPVHARLHALGRQLIEIEQDVPDPERRARCRQELAEVGVALNQGIQLLQAEVLMSGMNG